MRNRQEIPRRSSSVVTTTAVEFGLRRRQAAPFTLMSTS
jgi:hypothetical protein